MRVMLNREITIYTEQIRRYEEADQSAMSSVSVCPKDFFKKFEKNTFINKSINKCDFWYFEAKFE